MRSPIVMAAVDVDQAAAGLLEQLRETVRRIVVTEPGARLACVSVMKTARIGIDELVDREGQQQARQAAGGAQALGAAIQQALQLDDGRLTFHVLEAPDPAAAIVDSRRTQPVDHIVMGARGQVGAAPLPGQQCQLPGGGHRQLHGDGGAGRLRRS
jgi:nucleotide-binding universal stress UspA family protein